MIEPTPGRVVWYWPAAADAVPTYHPLDRDEQPLAAIVAYVWTPRLVNLVVFDVNGLPHGRASVQLLQDDDARPSARHLHYAEWMPYQKKVAAGEISPTLHATKIS